MGGEIKKVAILGATGSVGASALSVLRRLQKRFAVAALVADKNDDALLALCREFNPRYAALRDKPAALRLSRALGNSKKTEVLAGASGVRRLAGCSEVDIVIAATPGAVGLGYALAAARAGKRVLLANKEALVLGGDALLTVAAANGAEILPIDSEHSALLQLLDGANDARRDIKKVWLTASGGPFLNAAFAEMRAATPQAACRHPNWRMGKKISVDSATLMNKGLEVIEAAHLFGFGARQIGVVIHPQSVAHALVEYADGALTAQLSAPDMRLPIGYALMYPRRLESKIRRPDWAQLSAMEFRAPDVKRFNCLPLAFAALRAGGAAPAILNAANEVAVAKFMRREIALTDIAGFISATMDKAAGTMQKLAPAADCESRIADLIAADAAARRIARGIKLKTGAPR